MVVKLTCELTCIKEKVKEGLCVTWQLIIVEIHCRSTSYCDHLDRIMLPKCT